MCTFILKPRLSSSLNPKPHSIPIQSPDYAAMISFLLREHSRKLTSLLECSGTLAKLEFVRSMGGGPRTFPGGLNKWQWKRMHEKKARDKEKRLLDQEKQLYQARIRSEIRANLAGQSNTQLDTTRTHDPMSPKEQIKALADRFMKEGAEDLWNKDDGPLKPPPPKSAPYGQSGPIQARAPVDLRKMVAESGRSFNVADNVRPIRAGGHSYCSFRKYSVQSFGRNESSESENNPRVHLRSRTSSGKSTKVKDTPKTGKITMPRKKRFFKSNDSSSDDSDLDSEEDNDVQDSRSRWPRLVMGEVEPEEEKKGKFGGMKKGKFGGRASFGEYDIKRKKRVPLNSLEDECDFAQEVETLKYELKKKNYAEDEGGRMDEDSVLMNKRFDECDISPLTIKALSLAGYVQMTRVQEATLSVCLEGKDALVKAKTGTGKSAAFLLPAIETVLKPSTTTSRNQRVPPVHVLILCPTRELASQIAAEAKALLKYHEGIGVQTLVGGTRFKDDQKRLESEPCEIVVATPGRLLDHIENKSSLSLRLMGLKMLILDEADHLLDLGFRKDVEKIVDSIPRQRQSLLFSATVPKEVRRVSQLVLKREHEFIDTVGMGCVETPAKVRQSYLIAPHETHFHIIYQLLKDHILRTPDYKVIVFCTTGMSTSLLYLLMRETKMNVREIHSRKPQLYRTRVSDEFKQSKQMILITSDVSTRGMNYPDVTLVIQAGIPSDREQYIHRLGRTGREGKYGEGILILAPWEEYFLKEIKDLPLEKLPLPFLDPLNKLKVEESLAKVDTSVKEGAYHAWLGYYNSVREIGRDKTTLVELARRFGDSIGLQTAPSLFRKTALKMGLKDVPGIKIRK